MNSRKRIQLINGILALVSRNCAEMDDEMVFKMLEAIDQELLNWERVGEKLSEENYFTETLAFKEKFNGLIRGEVDVGELKREQRDLIAKLYLYTYIREEGARTCRG